MRLTDRASAGLLALLVGAVCLGRAGARLGLSQKGDLPKFWRASISFSSMVQGRRRAQSPNNGKARRDSAQPVGAFHNSDALNLAKRRLCDAVRVSLGSAAHC